MNPDTQSRISAILIAFATALAMAACDSEPMPEVPPATPAAAPAPAAKPAATPAATPTAAPTERATKEEAKAMVEAAVALIKAVGPEQAAKEFMSGDAKWKNKDLYISMYDVKDNHVVIYAHGVNSKLIGKDLTDLKDADDKPFLREGLKLMENGGWVDYKWPDPATKKVNDKTSYILKVPGMDYAILVGVYK